MSTTTKPKPAKIIETPVYNFDDLSEDAKERARDWFREFALDYDWWDSTFEDAKTIGLEITSFDLDRNRHATGSLTMDALSVCEAIEANHGKDCETYKTAQQYKGEFRNETDSDEYEDAKDEFLKSLLEDYAIMLQHESEYLVSDEVVDDTIQANEYTFTETGEREG